MVIALGAAMHGNATGGGDQFSRLVRHILVKEKRDSISSLASAMGMSYANFHARVIGRVRFRPDEINQLIHVLPDPRLSEFLLRGTAFMAVARPRPRLPQLWGRTSYCDPFSECSARNHRRNW